MKTELEKRNEREATIQGLRDLALFLECHDKAPLPFVYQMTAFVEDDADLREVALAVGSANKEFNHEWLYLKKQFGPVGYAVSIQRERVCAKKVVGVREVPAHTEEIVEWSCSESLLAAEGK